MGMLSGLDLPGRRHQFCADDCRLIFEGSDESYVATIYIGVRRVGFADLEIAGESAELVVIEVMC